jgi:Protein of unknown function (DUF4199)
MKPILKTPFIFGLGTGMICFLYFVILNAIGISPLGLTKELNLGFIFFAMIASVWYYKHQIRGGYLHLWEGLTICYLTCMIAALFNGILMALYISFIDPDILKTFNRDNLLMLLKTKQQFVEQFDEKTFQELMASLKKTTPFDITKDEIGKKLFWGIVLALPISMYFRRQDYSIMQGTEPPASAKKK